MVHFPDAGLAIAGGVSQSPSDVQTGPADGVRKTDSDGEGVGGGFCDEGGGTAPILAAPPHAEMMAPERTTSAAQHCACLVLFFIGLLVVY